MTNAPAMTRQGRARGDWGNGATVVVSAISVVSEGQQLDLFVPSESIPHLWGIVVDQAKGLLLDTQLGPRGDATADAPHGVNSPGAYPLTRHVTARWSACRAA